MADNTRINEMVLKEVEGFIRGISYGEVIIVVHDSKVVQIEKREKKRFRAHGSLPKQGRG